MLILASASKARAGLLNQVGIPHRVMISGVNEEAFTNPDHIELVLSLAHAKAERVSNSLKESFLDHFENTNESYPILGCDSVFEFQGEIFGKPRNLKEAFYRLQKMSSKSGWIHTGHALLYKKSLLEKKNQFESEEKILKVISTRIYFSEFTSDQILEYVNTGEPMKSAGGFAIEGKGASLIKGIDGCFSNVIGLSLPWLVATLSKSGLHNLIGY